MNLKLRIAQSEDVSAMHVIRVTVKENILSDPNRITPEDYLEFITEKGKGWVALLDSKIVGFAIVDCVEDNVWALFVSPEYEGLGIGLALQNKMLEWYFQQGKSKIWLSTDPNSRAAGFYRKTGWTETGTYGKNEIKFEQYASKTTV